MKSLLQEKQAQEQELVTAKVQWATLELECDRLRHDLRMHEDRERALAAEKYEESLKLSILEKQNEITEKIRARKQERAQLKPQIKKLGRLFSFANPGKQAGKHSRD